MRATINGINREVTTATCTKCRREAEIITIPGTYQPSTTGMPSSSYRCGTCGYEATVFFADGKWHLGTGLPDDLVPKI